MTILEKHPDRKFNTQSDCEVGSCKGGGGCGKEIQEFMPLALGVYDG